jgi:hypothetical protein
MQPTYWTVKIQCGSVIFRKGMKITPTDRNTVIEDDYVRREVERQQQTMMYREGRTAMPEGRIISIERRDPTKPTPAHVGHWQKHGVIFTPPERRMI